jgi:hypothetical protein
MTTLRAIALEELCIIRARRHALTKAIERGRSPKWLFRLWSQFIKTRDRFRCLCCGATEKIHAHHVIRKTLYPLAAFDLGNGITLCRECHRRVHALFNGKPDLSLPLGAEQGDDQDEWAFLFGLLLEDAKRRDLPEYEFYYLNDAVLRFFVGFQGYKDLYEVVMQKKCSRIRFAHEMWGSMPERFYTNFVSELVRLNFLED